MGTQTGRGSVEAVGNDLGKIFKVDNFFLLFWKPLFSRMAADLDKFTGFKVKLVAKMCLQYERGFKKAPELFYIHQYTTDGGDEGTVLKMPFNKRIISCDIK